MNGETTIRAVVFDLDGLMFNTEDLYNLVGRELLARRGTVYTQDLAEKMLGRRTPEALQIMIDWHALPDSVEQLTEETQQIMEGLLDGHVRPMPGLTDLLDALCASRRPIGIATSSRRVHATALLSRFRWQDRFRFVLTGEDVQHGKPHPEIYLQASQRIDVPPQEMMVLEDSPVGCQAALAAGAFTVAVPSHVSPHGNVDRRFEGVQLMARSLRDRRIYSALGLHGGLEEPPV